MPVLLCRDSRQVTVQVTVGEEVEPVPSVEPAPLLAQPANKTFELGLTLAPADPGLRTRFQLPSDQGGLVVTGVSGGGTAADLGIAVGNVVVKGRQPSPPRSASPAKPSANGGMITAPRAPPALSIGPRADIAAQTASVTRSPTRSRRCDANACPARPSRTGSATLWPPSA